MKRTRNKEIAAIVAEKNKIIKDKYNAKIYKNIKDPKIFNREPITFQDWIEFTSLPKEVKEEIIRSVSTRVVKRKKRKKSKFDDEILKILSTPLTKRNKEIETQLDNELDREADEEINRCVIRVNSYMTAAKALLKGLYTEKEQIEIDNLKKDINERRKKEKRLNKITDEDIEIDMRTIMYARRVRQIDNDSLED